MENDQVIDIDQEQLAQILANAEGAELMDGQGHLIRVRADQLIEVGMAPEAIQAAHGGQIIFQDTSEYINENVGHYYVIGDNGEAEEPYTGIEDAPVLKKEVMTTKKVDTEDRLPPPTLPLLGRSSEMSVDQTENDLNDAEKLRFMLDECRREMQEKDKRIRETERSIKQWNRKSQLLSSALVKTMNSKDAEVLLTSPGSPGNTVAKVVIRSLGANEPAPDNSFAVYLENGSSCLVVVEYPSEMAADNSAQKEGGGPEFIDCDRCPKRFANAELLKQHVDSAHPNKGTFYCRYCEREVFFPNEANFQAHIRLCHKGTLQQEAATPTDTPCDSVPEEEPDWETLYADSVVEASDSCVYKCSLCHAEVKGIAESRSHAKEAHNITSNQRVSALLKPFSDGAQQTFGCSKCAKKFSKKAFLDYHAIAHANDAERMTYACKFCGKMFVWNENLQKHLATHESHGPVKCPDCKQMFSNSTRLDVHYKARHATRGHKFSCSLCMKTFAVKDALTKHMLSHGQWPCNDCGKRFADEAFLIRHQATHTAQGQDFVCDVCEKVFVLPVNLSIHRNLHTGERPYECDNCGKYFSSRTSWKVHEASHDASKPFSCKHCKRRFVNESTLRVHMAVHQKNKPYKCADCGRCYERLEYLEVHCLNAKGSHRIKCPKCPLTFAVNEQLKRHIRVHDKKLSHKCKHCQLAFAKSEQLEKHLINVHVKADLPALLITQKRDGTSSCKLFQNGSLVEEDDLSKFYKGPIVDPSNGLIGEDGSVNSSGAVEMSDN